jgi:hypothetical protein
MDARPQEEGKRALVCRIQHCAAAPGGGRMLSNQSKITEAMVSTQDIQPLLDAKEVKRLLRCSLPLVYKLADQKRLPCVRIPCPGNGTKKRQNMVRFRLCDVLKFVEDHYVSP